MSPRPAPEPVRRPLSGVVVVCALAAAVAGVGLPATALANPLDAYGFGARASGMASAYTALADDSTATYYNPGGILAGEDLQLELGYAFVEPSLEIEGHDLGVDPVVGQDTPVDDTANCRKSHDDAPQSTALGSTRSHRLP